MAPVIDMKRTGENILALRKRAGLSVTDLSEALGFTRPQAVYRWQQGRSLPTVDNLVILAYLFGVTIDEILVLN